MTEQEWLTSQNSNPMLSYLRGKAVFTDRKQRLFMLACFTRVAHLLPGTHAPRVLELARLRAEGQAADEAEALQRELRAFALEQHSNSIGRQATFAAVALLHPDADQGVKNMLFLSRAFYDLPPGVVQGAMPTHDWDGTPDDKWDAQLAREADALREIVGWPVLKQRPRIDPAWLRFEHGLVPKLARGLEVDEDFGQMPVLADALQDAGCHDDRILDHCHRPRQHLRGCWLLDLVLAK